MRLPPAARRSWLFGAIAAVTAILCPAAAARLPAAPATPIVWTRPLINVPPAIKASLPDQGLDLVSLVAADIDADGDLDVVASDSKLDLFVWVNDGQGHLTRRQFQRSTQWQPEPGDPSVHDLPDGASVSVQNEPPSVGVDMRLAFDTRRPARVAPRGTTPAAAVTPISTRVPRAPPSALRS